ncbi:alpha-D-ribose 1-methylphosphonate 5-triphosphate diphosphatase [Kaistia sp. K-TC2]|uniref:Alpha-D-ribose 1-methylphosphonate 5-triphosphate diphosphatase n=2 Tax=Kaistiaceae TaxID=2831111 RepID=A0A9X3ECN5_9HYPH|nr:alpha-D-ribose 1-methylphosphonate 5-triphosphate diphosphatase [Kaistia nematophila]MBN9027434.1 alpha-D-ribose 1-methylphosphonate 5-triphosphate diphosphatase [Hyphomicrobiales bacterium]MCX5570490.1 alpha-D-ribose 1-methylphosphonate 5-triphosphate diphosphatase [Kaistia nematophila]
MREQVFANARIVLEDEIVEGSLVLRDGLIADFDTGPTRLGDDVEGDYLVPGFVELHTDHLEGHYAPRPGVRWNPIAAVQAHDAQVAGAGITTVFDALRVGMDEDARTSTAEMQNLADAIETAKREDRLRVDHLLHLRCEVSAPDVLDGLAGFLDVLPVRLVSLMDHSPGQRQFASLDSYRAFYQGKMGMSDAAYEAFASKRIAQAEEFSARHRREIVDLCHPRRIAVASHDDATVAHVDEAASDGVSIAEFPTTVEAAAASQAADIRVLMGAPNLVRGGSHSGNVSAAALAEAGHLDILSSDYVPFSLMIAVFSLPEIVPSIRLPEAVRLVTRAPAEAVGLTDRGAIRPGLRADIVRVRAGEGVPVVRSVWRHGQRVA